MEEFNSKYKISEISKKYLPIISIILLTFLLMVIFKYNKRNISRLIDEGKNNLVSFYTQNLKPLFASTEITNEDVFNFALYNTIPIDKENKKLLLVSNSDNNNQVFEVKPASYIPYTDNYERFVDYLELNSYQKLSVDSILGAYKKEIYLSILKNDKNALAISSQLGDLQKAILADLIAFSEKVNSNKTVQLFPLSNTNLDVVQLKSYANIAKEIPIKDFIVITPDTVFQAECEIDTKAFDKLSDIDLNKHIEAAGLKNSIRINVDLDRKLNENRRQNLNRAIEISHTIDSNVVKVVVPMPRIPRKPRISPVGVDDSIKVKLEKAAENLKMFSIKWESSSKGSNNKLHSKVTRFSKNGEPIRFHFNFDPEAFAKQALNFSKDNYKDWEKFGNKMDSFSRDFEKVLADSIKNTIKLRQDKFFKKKQSEAIAEKDSIQ